MMNPDPKHGEPGAAAASVTPSPALRSREETLRAFFLGRLDYLVRLRDGSGDSLKPADDLLIKRAIYSTYRDCLSLGVGDEARSQLGRS